MKTYILKDKVPVPELDMMVWSQWMGENDTRVKISQVNESIEVSTVFLGIAHGFENSKIPILFESMVFSDDNHDNYCVRYATWDDAEKGHDNIVNLLNNEVDSAKKSSSLLLNNLIAGKSFRIKP
jgi:hypothetical protein